MNIAKRPEVIVSAVVLVLIVLLAIYTFRQLNDINSFNNDKEEEIEVLTSKISDLLSEKSNMEKNVTEAIGKIDGVMFKVRNELDNVKDRQEEDAE